VIYITVADSFSRTTLLRIINNTRTYKSDKVAPQIKGSTIFIRILTQPNMDMAVQQAGMDMVLAAKTWVGPHTFQGIPSPPIPWEMYLWGQ
jgi:hypothetical protein